MKSDLQALIITASGVLCHVYRIYPIGARGDEWLDCYQANFTSVCFVVGVSLLLSLRDLWPSALKKPPQPVLCVYLALMSAFFTSLSLRMIWLPLTMSITQTNLWMAYKLRTMKTKVPLILKLIDILESQILQNLEIGFLAVFFLVYALKASGIYKGTTPATVYPKPGHLKADMLKKSRSSFRGPNMCRKFVPEVFEETVLEEDILRDGTNFFSEMVYNGGFREVINNYVSSNL